jgi:hypothetical protein
MKEMDRLFLLNSSRKCGHLENQELNGTQGIEQILDERFVEQRN